jgi:hypothetical protein
MKNILIVITFLFAFNAFSQKKNFDYKTLSKPNPKNELSLYLKKEVPKKYLKKARFKEKGNPILLSFKINNENKPFRVSVSSDGSSNLNDAIKRAFEKYPLEKLNIEKIDRSHLYYLQVISKKGWKNIFNTSSKVIIETPTKYKKCNDLEFYDDLKTCLNLEVQKHLYKTLDFSKLANKYLKLDIQFAVNTDGKLINKKSDVPLNFLYEIKNALNSFPKIESASTFNSNKIEVLHCFSIVVEKDKIPVYKDYSSITKETSYPTADNPFALYMSKNLSKEIISKADLNRINNSVYINFEMDKNNKPFNINSNSRSEDLETEIFSLFQKYPIDKLNLIDKSKFNKHSLQILTFENNKNIIKTNTRLTAKKAPIFPNCENSENIKASKKCFSKEIQRHFAANFNLKLLKNTGLSKGKKKVFAQFKIDSNGDIKNVKVKSPHPAITLEIKKVMYTLPKIVPGKINGNNVDVTFNIPFTLIII